MTLPAGLRDRLAELYPDAAIVRVTALRDDETGGEEMKALGYGRPLKVELAGAHTVVFHTARPDDFGHDRRSDRTANLMLAFDTFGKLPHHVAAIDMGLVRSDGTLASLADTGEPYLITSWVEGTLYADDLRRVGTSGVATPEDIARAETLARVLLEIHAVPGSHPGAYTRAIRDLLGHGEGVFGLVDSYPPGAVPAARLRAIEEACLAWRWKLRERTHRLRRTHGDFHPFNLVFSPRGLVLLDASRGSEGDPADDVACATINYPFFGRGQGLARSMDGVLARLPRRRHRSTCSPRSRRSTRGARSCSPRPIWYPHSRAGDRDRILGFAERALAAERFDPAWGLEAMT